MLPKVVFIQASFDREAPKAERLSRRLQWLPGVAYKMGVYLELLEGLEDEAQSLEKLQGARAVWWGGRIIFESEGKSFDAALAKAYKKLGESPIMVDQARAVEQCFNLSLSYPALAKIGLEQASTDFIALPEINATTSDERVQELISERLASYQVEDWGHFLRTYYGTLKKSPYWNLVHSRDTLISRGVYMVKYLKDHQDIGGLAIRRRLAIKVLALGPQQSLFMPEFRVFVADGRPLMWSCDLDLNKYRGILSPDELRRLGQLSGEQHQQLYDWSKRAGEALEARFVVADFALLEDDSLALVEVNPGHSSGWAHDIAFPGVYGRWCRHMAGLPRMEAEACYDLAKELNIDLWGRDIVYGLYD